MAPRRAQPHGRLLGGDTAGVLSPVSPCLRSAASPRQPGPAPSPLSSSCPCVLPARPASSASALIPPAAEQNSPPLSADHAAAPVLGGAPRRRSVQPLPPSPSQAPHGASARPPPAAAAPAPAWPAAPPRATSRPSASSAKRDVPGPPVCRGSAAPSGAARGVEPQPAPASGPSQPLGSAAARTAGPAPAPAAPHSARPRSAAPSEGCPSLSAHVSVQHTVGYSEHTASPEIFLTPIPGKRREKVNQERCQNSFPAPISVQIPQASNCTSSFYR